MRRFFRFSIRDLLWLTLVVTVALGWFVREGRLKAEADRANRLQGVAKRLQKCLGVEYGTDVSWDLETGWWTWSSVPEDERNAMQAKRGYFRGSVFFYTDEE